ncbi:hypothetical protein BHE74_00032821 [Ensete ventricosum]|nr:hypothetical protein BHE74_00032821 [Ensete ventricosum]
MGPKVYLLCTVPFAIVASVCSSFHRRGSRPQLSTTDGHIRTSFVIAVVVRSFIRWCCHHQQFPPLLPSSGSFSNTIALSFPTFRRQ